LLLFFQRDETIEISSWTTSFTNPPLIIYLVLMTTLSLVLFS